MAVVRTKIVCGDLQGELQVFQQGSEPCYRVVPDESAKLGRHQPALHLDNGRAFYLPSAFESMSGRQRSQNWKRSVHVFQDGVKGETLLRWLKRQGVIQLGAEWHRHLYDLPAPPKQPSKATAAQRSMPPMQEGRPCTVPAAASASPTCTAAPAAAWQASAEQEAAQAAAGAPAAPATPTAQRLKPGHSEPAKNPVPAAKDPQEAGARPAPESRDGAESDSDISIGMWDLPPGPPREGLLHVAVKMEENGHIADAEIKLETTTCANPSQVDDQDSAVAAAPKGSVSSDDLPLSILRRPVPLPYKQSVLTADWVDSSRGPDQGVQSQEGASSCPSQQVQRQHVRRQSHRVLDDSEEETGPARAPGSQRLLLSSCPQLHLPRQQWLSGRVAEDSDDEAGAATAPGPQRKSRSSPRQLHLLHRLRHCGHVVVDSDEETEAARGPVAQAEPVSSSGQLQRQRRPQRLSSQVLEDSEEEAEAAAAPVACTQEGKGGAAEAHEAHLQPAATQGRQLQQPPTNSGRQQEGQVKGHLRATETCSAEPEEAASSGSSQQPLRARLRRRQAAKRPAQHAVTGAKRKAESPVEESPKKLREVADNAGCQPGKVTRSPPASQGSPVQADQAAHAMPALHAEVQHAADMADSAASQHTPAQGSPARTSHSLVTPVPERDSYLQEAPQGPQLGTAGKQSPTHDLRQRQAELQARNDALEASASAAEAEALQLRAKLGAAQSEAAKAREQLQAQLGCMRTMATASDIATATARKLLVERHALQGRLSKVMQEKVDVKAIWAGCGNRAIALKMDDLKQQLQREVTGRASAEQQVAELKQQVKRLQAETMQSAMSALAALQHTDQKSRSLQAEVGKIKGSLQAEIVELVRRKGTEVAALQEQMAVLRAQNKDLSTALSRAWSCQKTAQAQLQARLSTTQSQGPAAESGQASGEQQSAARRQQDECPLSHAIQAFEHAASRMNQKPALPQGAVATAAGPSMALEAQSAVEEAHKKLQAHYDALLATLGICGQLFVALGRPAVAASIMAYLQGARAPDAPQQR